MGFGGVSAIDESDTVVRRAPMFHHPRDSIHAHLTIVFTALAVARHLQGLSGVSIRKLVRTLRPLRDVTIRGGEHEITAPTPPEGDAADILASLSAATEVTRVARLRSVASSPTRRAQGHRGVWH